MHIHIHIRLYLVDVDVEPVIDLIASLREEGSDTTRVEVKSARGGFPEDLQRTLSAFGNTPGGGAVLLGFDEKSGFAPVGVYDVADAQSRLAALARQAIEPPVTIHTASCVYEGVRVVMARIAEASAASKPCRVRASGKAYLRAYDGDYEMSDLEAQAFIANRDHPRFDRAQVEGATAADLDAELVDIYRDTCRRESPRLARFDKEEILLRTGVLREDGRPSLAGLLVLGVYPQQFVPNLVIQASVAPRPDDPPGTRASDVRKFDGPLPVMLDEASSWIRRNTRTRVRFGYDGHGRDEPEYPTDAVRELLSNALIHRDLGPHAMPYPIYLKLEHNQLVLSNPGGLWGITVDRLGREPISSARNDTLLRIAQNSRSSDGRRVVEGLASGIPTILQSLRRAGMVPPNFHDQGVRFTVRVPNHALLAAEDLEWLQVVSDGRPLSDTQRHALVAMRHGRRWTNSTYRAEFPRDSRDARADLQGLVDVGLAVAHGERGGRTYSLAPEVTGTRRHDLFTDLDDDSAVPSEQRSPRVAPRERNAQRVLAELTGGPASRGALVSRTNLSGRQVEYALELLRARSQVEIVGGQGVRSTVYRLSGSDEPST